MDPKFQEHLQTQLHLAQAGLSAYSFIHSLRSITNLQKWEDTSKKAAKVSETAAHELHKTRTTQTSGALVILFSLGCALGLSITTPESDVLRTGINIINVVICVFARTHISNFWGTKGKIPMAQSYNDAINSTLVIKKVLGYLALAWLATSLLEAQNLWR